MMETAKKLHVVTSAFPFVPARLHLGNIGSTYLPADICCRMLKAFDLPAVHVCATDVHSILASGDGKSISPEVCDACDAQYRDVFRRMNISFDQYIRTDDCGHVHQVYQVIADLSRAQLIEKRMADDTVCDNCGVTIPARLLENGRCPYCGSDLISVHRNAHYFLEIESQQEWLRQQLGMHPQPEIRNSVKSYCDEGLKNWDFTRINSYGIPYPDESGLAIYLWFESLVGYLSLCRKYEADAYRFVHFFGKNIIYYHSIIWPVMLRFTRYGAKSEYLLAAKGFARLEQSDPQLIDIEEALRLWDADFIRFYLSYKIRDDIRDYTFKVHDFENVVRTKLLYRICNLNYRAFHIVKSAEPNGLPAPGWEFEEITACIADIRQELDDGHIHGMLARILDFCDYCNKRLTEERWRDPRKEENIAFLLCMNNFLCVALRAFIPGLTARLYYFENWKPETFSQVGMWPENGLKKCISKVLLP